MSIEKNIKGVNVIITDNSDFSEEELINYIDRYNQLNPDRKLEEMSISLAGDEVELSYTQGPEKFERIRRITGYLVGDMTKWNDGKCAEEHDRVKHSVGGKILNTEYANSKASTPHNPVEYIRPIENDDYQNLEKGAVHTDYKYVGIHKDGSMSGLTKEEYKIVKKNQRTKIVDSLKPNTVNKSSSEVCAR